MSKLSHISDSLSQRSVRAIGWVSGLPAGIILAVVPPVIGVYLTVMLASLLSMSAASMFMTFTWTALIVEVFFVFAVFSGRRASSLDELTPAQMKMDVWAEDCDVEDATLNQIKAFFMPGENGVVNDAIRYIARRPRQELVWRLGIFVLGLALATIEILLGLRIGVVMLTVLFAAVISGYVTMAWYVEINVLTKRTVSKAFLWPAWTLHSRKLPGVSITKIDFARPTQRYFGRMFDYGVYGGDKTASTGDKDIEEFKVRKIKRFVGLIGDAQSKSRV